MTNTERMKKYRATIKKDSKTRSNESKRSRWLSFKIAKLTGVSLAKFRTETKLCQQKCRENKKKCLVNKPPLSSFKCHQSFGKA